MLYFAVVARSKKTWRVLSRALSLGAADTTNAYIISSLVLARDCLLISAWLFPCIDAHAPY